MPRRKSSPTKTLGSVVGGIIIAILAVLGGSKFVDFNSILGNINGSSGVSGLNSTSIPSGGSSSGVASAGLPDQSFRQSPQEITFHGCPPEGDGGDPTLNRNKNRVDSGNFQPTAFNTILNLPWPKATEKKAHADWSSADQQQVAQSEGLPVMVEGYFALARQEGPETPNCHSSTDFDFHTWVIDHAGGSADRTGAIVSEVTPRVRASHPTWTVSGLNRLATSGTKVRISGWLMYDPEHPEQLGSSGTRGTLWEIHPIIRIEVWQGNTWVNFDNYQG